MSVALIAALDRRKAIGVDGGLPWHLPDDLRRFKKLTLGSTILMGGRTARSIGRALPGRRNLVLTRSTHVPAGMERVASVDDAIGLAAGTLNVIGGGEVYALTLPRADRLLLTHVDAELARADAWFPEYDASRWRAVFREHHSADAKHAFAFEFVDYERVG